MKKIISFVFALAVVMLTGCAAQQPNVVPNPGIGVSTQSRDSGGYAVVPQQSNLIPYTVIGKPNEVHYLDRNTVSSAQVQLFNNTATVSVPQPQYNYNDRNYNNGSNYGNTYGNRYQVPQNNVNDVYGNNVNNGNYNNGNRYQVPQSNPNTLYGNNSNYSNGNSYGGAVAYVAPTTRAPAYGYEWRYHNRYGWGWLHPQYGWYLGWK